MYRETGFQGRSKEEIFDEKASWLWVNNSFKFQTKIFLHCLQFM